MACGHSHQLGTSTLRPVTPPILIAQAGEGLAGRVCFLATAIGGIYDAMGGQFLHNGHAMGGLNAAIGDPNGHHGCVLGVLGPPIRQCVVAHAIVVFKSVVDHAKDRRVGIGSEAQRKVEVGHRLLVLEIWIMLRRFKVRACPDLTRRPQFEILVEVIQTVEYTERVENCSPCGACALTP